MNENERPTPLVDNEALNINCSGMMIFKKNGDYVKADFARKLERMCAELAEAMEIVKNNAHLFEFNAVAKQALARYAAMKEGKL